MFHFQVLYFLMDVMDTSNDCVSIAEFQDSVNDAEELVVFCGREKGSKINSQKGEKNNTI